MSWMALTYKRKQEVSDELSMSDATAIYYFLFTIAPPLAIIEEIASPRPAR
jgi:hypothetical protein